MIKVDILPIRGYTDNNTKYGGENGIFVSSRNGKKMECF